MSASAPAQALALARRRPAKRGEKKQTSDLLRTRVSKDVRGYILSEYLQPVWSLALVLLSKQWSTDKLIRRMLAAAKQVKRATLERIRYRTTPTVHTFTTPAGLTQTYQMPPPKRKGKKQRDREKAKAAASS